MGLNKNCKWRKCEKQINDWEKYCEEHQNFVDSVEDIIRHYLSENHNM